MSLNKLAAQETFINVHLIALSIDCYDDLAKQNSLFQGCILVYVQTFAE